jgi:hypothetical protein
MLDRKTDLGHVGIIEDSVAPRATSHQATTLHHSNVLNFTFSRSLARREQTNAATLNIRCGSVVIPFSPTAKWLSARRVSNPTGNPMSRNNCAATMHANEPVNTAEEGSQLSAAESLRNEFMIATAQFDSARELTMRGSDDSARHAADQGFETLRLTLRNYAATVEYRAFSDWWIRARMADSDIPVTALNLEPVRYAAGRCTQSVALCDVVPEDVRERVVFWLEAFQEEDGAGAVPNVIAESTVAQRVLRHTKRGGCQCEVHT